MLISVPRAALEPPSPWAPTAAGRATASITTTPRSSFVTPGCQWHRAGTPQPARKVPACYQSLLPPLQAQQSRGWAAGQGREGGRERWHSIGNGGGGRACASHSAPTKQSCSISTSSPSWGASGHCTQLKLPVYHPISSPFAEKLTANLTKTKQTLPQHSQSSCASQHWCSAGHSQLPSAAAKPQDHCPENSEILPLIALGSFWT